MPLNRIAALDGGTFYHHFTLTDPAIAPLLTRTIYLRKLKAEDLDDIDTLIVSSRCNSGLLYQHRAHLQAFLMAGKRLVVMGETEPQDWLPGVGFQPLPTNFWWWLEPGATLGLTVDSPEHPLFDYLTQQDCTWHYHGQFSVPCGAESLLSCREGGSILVEDRCSWPGTLILTSLDPCYHHGSFFMPNATRFLKGFMNYLAWHPIHTKTLNNEHTTTGASHHE